MKTTRTALETGAVDVSAVMYRFMHGFAGVGRVYAGALKHVTMRGMHFLIFHMGYAAYNSHVYCVLTDIACQRRSNLTVPGSQ